MEDGEGQETVRFYRPRDVATCVIETVFAAEMKMAA